MTRPPDADPQGGAPLSPERWARVRALVEEALTHSADERPAWLAASCGSDEALRRSVENLAASFERGASWEFLARPAGEFAGPLVAADPAFAGDMKHPFDRLRNALAPRYHIQRELATGGMATVYVAQDVRHEREVAIKVLHPELSALLGAERFLSEIRTTAALQHPHVVPLFDSGVAGGLLYYVMPLVEGETLRARLVRERQLPVADAVRIVREVALALDYAHRRGIVHRDVKPENILLSSDGPTQLADFGIARAGGQGRGGGEALTGTGLTVGTPMYMSPEQGSGERDVDGRSDQYALACVLYECLAGEPPFTGSTPQAVLAKRFAGPAPNVSVLREGIAPGVQAALARALGRSPADRFPTASAFEAALAAAGSVATRTHSTITGTTLPNGRRLGIAVGLGLVALAVVSGVVWRRAQDGHERPASLANVSTPAEGAPLVIHQRTFSGTAEEPSFSPDGRQIAYVETQCDSTAGREVGCTAALRLQDVHSAQTTTIATGKYMLHPFWTADGEWVLVLMQPKVGEDGTYIIPRLGGSMRRLGPGTLVAFTATGDTILLAALAAPGAPRFVRKVRAATGETIDSTALARDLTDLQGLLPSPDGRWIVLRLADRLLLATPQDRRVTDSLMFDNAGSLRWDPRGDALYAVVWGGIGKTTLMRVRVDGRHGRFASRMEPVLNLGASAGTEFDIAPDGRTLVHTGGTVTATLWALDLAGRPVAPRKLIASTSWLGTPFLSSDGQLVTYDATDQVGDNVYVIPFAGGRAQAVIQEAGGRHTSGWIAGSHRLTYADSGPQSARYAQEFPDGTRRVIGGGAASPLGDGGSVELDARGHRIIFRAADRTERAVVLPDSLRGFVRLWDTDADGSGAYVKIPKAVAGAPPSSRVFRVDRASGVMTVVLELPQAQLPYPLGAQDLTAQHGAVVYATWPSARPTVWRAPAGRPAKVAELPLECTPGALTMSADGRRYACAQWAPRPDVFLVEHFDRYRGKNP